jgi:hypothetical protein
VAGHNAVLVEGDLGGDLGDMYPPTVTHVGVDHLDIWRILRKLDDVEHEDADHASKCKGDDHEEDGSHSCSYSYLLM